jgi:hypothetical protein
MQIRIYENEKENSIAKIDERTFYMEVDNKWDKQFKDGYEASKWLHDNGYKHIGFDR